jgi:hypothetical protein
MKKETIKRIKKQSRDQFKKLPKPKVVPGKKVYKRDKKVDLPNDDAY